MRPAATANETQVLVDAVNEQVLLAAAMVDPSALERLAARVRPSHLAAPEHQAAWEVLLELRRKGLEFDPATVQQLSGGRVDAGYLASLCELRPEPPPNLDHHVEALFWDHARIEAVRGPLAALLAAIKDPTSPPDKVRGHARQLAQSFDGYQDRRHLRDPGQLVRGQSLAIEARVARGVAVYPYGLPGLDADEEGEPRMIPGAAPGQITLLTGISGSGKTTVLCHLILGIARQRRKVLVGSWEMGAGVTLELLACVSRGLSRTDVLLGRLSEADRALIDATMEAIARFVRFVDNPFRGRRGRGKGAPSTADNLELLGGYVADSGCEVFACDLLRRAFASSDPDEEEFALYTFQEVLQDLGVHAVVSHQQRLKDVEQRPDKRPTREGNKGSSAWVEVADTMIGTNRPALWKAIDDVILELHVLKQRYGAWPMLIEFDWDGRRGAIGNGRRVPYDYGAEAGGDGEGIFQRPQRRGGSNHRARQR